MKKFFSIVSVALVCLSANAQVNLADVIKNSVANAKVQVAEGKTYYEVAPVTLTESKTYVLDSSVDLGTQNLVIYGGGAKVIVKGEGQIATSAYLKVYGVNFDCAEGAVAPIALSANPDSALYQFAAGDDKPRYQGANQKVFFNDNVVRISHCNFRELKTSLFYGNKASWALNTLAIEDCIVQLNHEKGDPVINLYGSSTGAIKHIVLTNNTLYNIVENKSSYFIRYGNASNAQPQKIWGVTASGAKETSDFVMQNNTLCQTMSGKDFANNFPNTNNVTLDWKKNIFFNTYRLQKIGQNNTRNFAVTDNMTWSTYVAPEQEVMTQTYTDGPFPYYQMGCAPEVINGAMHFVPTGNWSQFFCVPATPLEAGEYVCYVDITSTKAGTVQLTAQNGWSETSESKTSDVTLVEGSTVAKVSFTLEQGGNYDFILKPQTFDATLDLKSVKICKVNNVTNTVPAVDGTDKTKFATEANPGFTAPTTALDFDNIAALSDNFTNKSNDARFVGFGSSIFNAPAASDALDVTGISEAKAESQRVAPKKYINAKGQIVIGNYNIAGQRVK